MMPGVPSAFLLPMPRCNSLDLLWPSSSDSSMEHTVLGGLPVGASLSSEGLPKTLL